MGNGFRAGTVSETVSEYAGSMAEAMERALAIQYDRLYHRDLPAVGGEGRRLMFSAIAQGILSHLKDHAPDALSVAVDVTQTTGSHPILSENAAAIPVQWVIGGGLQIDPGDAQVRQQPGRIDSTGEGKVQVLTEGELL